MWESVFSCDQTLVPMFSSRALLLQLTVLPLYQFVWALLPVLCRTVQGWGQLGTPPVRGTAWERQWLQINTLQEGNSKSAASLGLYRLGMPSEDKEWDLLRCKSSGLWSRVELESEELLTGASQKITQTIRTLKEERNKRKTGERSRRAMWNKKQSAQKMMN